MDAIVVRMCALLVELKEKIERFNGSTEMRVRDEKCFLDELIAMVFL